METDKYSDYLLDDTSEEKLPIYEKKEKPIIQITRIHITSLTNDLINKLKRNEKILKKEMEEEYLDDDFEYIEDSDDK